MKGPARRLLADVRPLRESQEFRRFWIGTAVSSIGGSMTGFAVMLQAFVLTHSSAAVGLIGLAEFIPVLLLGLFGGSFADAVDRRRLVLITTSGMTVVSALFAVQAFMDLEQLWLLYVLAAVQAMLLAIDNPARRTFLPRLVPPDRIPGGVALTQLSGYISLLIGPVLAGGITAAAGLRVCYLIDAVSFAGTLYSVARLPPMPPQGSIRRPGLRATLDGLRYIRSQRVVLAVLLADLDATVLGMPVALFPAINAARFGGSPQTLGLLSGGLAAGGLMGSVLSGPAGRVSRKARAMLFTVVIWGGALAVFGLAHTLWLALLMLAVASAADTTSVIFRGSIVQLATPDRFRGRVTAVDYVVGAGGPALGNVRAGAVAELTSPAFSAVSGGLACIAGALVIRLACPVLARYDATAESAAPAPGQASLASAEAAD